MARFLLFSVSLLLITRVASAQSFTNSLGVAFSVLQASPPPEGETRTLIMQTGAIYFPRLNLTENEHASLSAGMPLMAGVGTVSNGGGFFFNADVPIVADYNMGCHSTPENESGFGGYFGGGFGYNYIGYSGYLGSGNVSSYGPLVHAGIRLIVSHKFSQIMAFGFSYKYGLESENYQTFGFNAVYEF